MQEKKKKFELFFSLLLQYDYFNPANKNIT